MTAKPRTLSQMQNRLSSFEIGLYVDGKCVDVLAYTERKTIAVLLSITMKNADIIKSYLSEDELDMPFKKSVKHGVSLGGGKVVICYTGYTERDAASKLGLIG